MQTQSLIADLEVSQWINTPTPLHLHDLRGRVVVIHAFQMLCRGCVVHGIPQAERVRKVFSEQDVVVLGLHTVFEHHAVMHADALRVFAHEYGLTMPIGIDRPTPGHPVPQTMQALQLRGTPSLILIDKGGAVRFKHFGQVDDLTISAQIGKLICEDQAAKTLPPLAGDAEGGPSPTSTPGQCHSSACVLA